MDACVCREALGHPFKTVEDSVRAVDSDAVVAHAELLARADKKDLRLLRCRVCATPWIEACYSSGQMMLYYLIPVPPTADPVRWMNEEAEELPTEAMERACRVKPLPKRLPLP